MLHNMLLIWQLSNWITIFFFFNSRAVGVREVVVWCDYTNWPCSSLHPSIKGEPKKGLMKAHLGPSLISPHTHSTAPALPTVFLVTVSTLLYLQTQLRCPFHWSWSLSKCFLLPTVVSAVNLAAWTYPFGNPPEIFQASEIFVLFPGG